MLTFCDFASDCSYPAIVTFTGFSTRFAAVAVVMSLNVAQRICLLQDTGQPPENG